MNRIGKLTEKIRELYESQNPDRDDWADWLYSNHVFLVADKSRELAERFSADKDLAEAAGMLHDIADAKMSRFDPAHEEDSLKIAKNLLKDSGFSEGEIKLIVEDVLHFHSCRDGKVPSSLEGKVMATADAVAHLSQGFYEHAIEYKKKGQSQEEIKKWGLPKIERDFHIKIFFDEIREEAREDYGKAKALFDF